MRFRHFSSGVVLGVLALAAAACSSKDKNGGGKTKNTEDAGGPPPPTWTNQAFDVQSTWHDTNEPKLTKDNVGSLVELWSAPVGIESTVSVVGNRIYVSASSGIAALDADSGAIIWKQVGTATEGIGSTASPTYDDGVLYIDNGPGGWIYALNADDGSIIWRTQVETHPFVAGYSTPIVYGNGVYVGVSSNEELGTTANATFKGSVVALDKRDGTMLWKSHTAGDGENGCAVWSTVALDPIGGTVFAATGNNYTEAPGPGSDSVFAFDMKTGEQKWHVQATTGDVFTISNPRSPDSDFGANPVVYDYKGKHYVAGGQKSGNVYIWDRDTGVQVEMRNIGKGSAFIGGVFQAFAFDGDYLYAVNNQATSTGANSEAANGDSASTSVLYALDPEDLTIAWERQLPAWVWAPMTIVNGMALVGPETHLEVIDLSDGSKLFDFKAVGTIIGAPVVNNGRVYVPSGLSYTFGHRDDKLHALALPDDPAVGKKFDAGKMPDLSAPTFTNVYKVVLAKNCIDSQCHGSTKQGNLGMSSQSEAYTSLVSVMASGKCAGADGGLVASCGCGNSMKYRALPGFPEASLLVEKLSGNPSCGDRMPPTGEPLSADLQNLVKNWITAGAPNN
jgi:polyvinyl alcohol dehydrogenase (cytochrome)